MLTDTRYHALPAPERCGLPECWCTPPEPPQKDYGTRPAEPDARLVPRDVPEGQKTYHIEERF